jgi:hypothetical protein
MSNILDNGDHSLLWDLISSDHKKGAGTDVNYYSVNKIASTMDPLYGEYTERKIDGPWRLPAIARWVQRSPMSAESGYTVEFDGTVTVSRISLEEKHASYPSENDIIEMWRTPFHDVDSMGEGLFFDVLKVAHKGFINDSPVFTDFVLTLKRRPQFSPERRIMPELPNREGEDT